MKKLTLFFVLILTVFFFSSCAHMPATGTSPTIQRILSKKALVVGTSGDQPPFSMTTQDGKIFGLDVDLARIIASTIGVELQLAQMPFNQLLPSLEAGKVDMVISGLTITPKRNLNVAFVGPYFISGKALLTKIRTIARIDNPGEINQADTILTALKGSTSQGFIRKFLPETTYIAARSYDDAIDLVLKDRVQALVADYPVCVISLFQHPNAGLVSLIKPFSYEPLGIALPGNDPLMTNWIQNLVNTLAGTGRLEELKMEWFEDASWIKQMAKKAKEPAKTE